MEESLLNYNFVLYKPYRNVLMGLAITWVILHHFSLYSPSLANIFIPFAKGSSGVEIFFFLSVYGLCFSYEKYGLKTFYLRRIQRIFPMYFVFIAIWYIGCILSGITIDNPVRIIINTVTCLSCISTLHTGHDIVEWYIPAQVFIYLTFPVLYKFVKKSSLLNTCKLTLIYFSFVTLGVVASLFASRPLYLRLPVIFLGVLTYFNGGG